MARFPVVCDANAAASLPRSEPSSTAPLPTISSAWVPVYSTVAARFTVPTPEKTTRPIDALPLAAAIAALNDPGPESFAFVTARSAADPVPAAVAATTAATPSAPTNLRALTLPPVRRFVVVSPAPHAPLPAEDASCWRIAKPLPPRGDRIVSVR